MKSKRVLSFILLLAMITSLSPSVSAESGSYNDTSDHWAASAIWKWSKLGILEGDGDGYFRPDDTVNQAEMAVIICRLMGYEALGETVYDELDDELWYAEYLKAAAGAGVLPDYWDPLSVSDGVERQEAVYIIAAALDLIDPDNCSYELSFTDNDEIADWAYYAVAAMVSSGYLSGYPDGSFRPGATLTRAEVITIIDNILGENYITYSTYVLEKLDIEEYSYDNSLFVYDENDWLTYTGSDSVTTGVDVSSYQGNIDWEAVASAGIDFAMIRVGYRGWGSSGSLNVDTYAVSNIEGALSAGLDVGVYFFSQATSEEEAEEEAEFVLSIIENYDISYPVVFDWENISSSGARTNSVSNSTLNACAAAFCETIAQAGYTPMIYFYTYLGLVRYDLKALEEYDVWLAQYASVPDYPYTFAMWQYTSEGTVPGISGSVDMNICFTDFSADTEDQD